MTAAAYPPEAARALDLLAGAGLRLAVLTNSPTETAERGLRAAGLRDRFAPRGRHGPGGRLQAGRARLPPRPRGHRRRARRGDDGRRPLVGPARGAGRGDARGWVGRGEGTLNPLLPEPDAQGADLLETRDDDRRPDDGGGAMRATRVPRAAGHPGGGRAGRDPARADRRAGARHARVHLRQRPVAVPRRAGDLRPPGRARATSSWAWWRRSARTCGRSGPASG